MEEYTFSAFVIDYTLFEKPQPHRVWWRRVLGQTESNPIGFRRLHYTFKAPPSIVDEDWFQDVLRASTGQNSYNLQIETSIPTSASKYLATTNQKQGGASYTEFFCKK